MIDYAQILSVNYAGSQWSINGDSYDGITWLSDTPKPTQAELDALWESTQNVTANHQAIAKRHSAYVAESDPLFFKAQRGEGTTAEWEAKVAEIKQRYPKLQEQIDALKGT
jgi:hypothetical protein